MDYAKATAILTPDFRVTHKIPAIPVITDKVWYCDQWWSKKGLEDGSSLPDFTEGSGQYHDRSEKEYSEFQQLHAILLAIGGGETCFPCLEEDMTAILERGYYRKGTSKMMVGRACQCHANVCELWERNHKDHDIRICTGYALSQDGMWRQHSWLVHYYKTATQNRVRVVETTTKRVAYYGFEMTDEEAKEFCENNW